MSFSPKSEFLNIINDRGFIHDSTDLGELDNLFQNKRVVGYIGYDATAKSLHVGHLVPLMMLRWLQKCGHCPITLMGGGTTKVGDPSFRSEERPILSDKEIKENMASLKSIFRNYLSYENSENAALMINNADWLEKINYLDFLRTIGKYFSVNRMLSFESVKSRIDRQQSLSFLEFNYMILQAFDFLELKRHYDCTVQFGGSDQWGNIVNGIELTRRVLDEPVFGLTCPLLSTSSGLKMGKTQNGAIWLNESLTSAYEFWQFWRNTEDGDVGKFMKLFTEIPLEECNHVAKLSGSEINEAKIILATEVTALCHGREKAENARITAAKVFSEGTIGDALPTFALTKSDFVNDLSIAHLFIKSGLASSGKEFKRLIANGGLKIDGKDLTRQDLKLSDIDTTEVIKLSVGKKRHALIKFSPD